MTVLALDGLTNKHFGHYALLKIFSLRSPRTEADMLYEFLLKPACEMDTLLKGAACLLQNFLP